MAASGLTPHNAAYPVSDDTNSSQPDPSSDLYTTELQASLNHTDINAYVFFFFFTVGNNAL